MKLKLDENFGTRTQRLFRLANHDIQTVHDERIQSCPDEKLFNICCEEERCLVTLDLDFADVVRFPPDRTNGIAVFRVPQNPSLALLEQLVRDFLRMLGEIPIKKHLWIVEVGRTRIHQSED
ncbi:MAG: DUF5615 family PIN-like protein [Bacteroidetes bacterium]|nr:DUF5615 family PIN-like protein [Bacteroidota bacterium]